MILELKNKYYTHEIDIKFSKLIKLIYESNCKLRSITEFENCLTLSTISKDDGYISFMRLNLNKLTDSSKLRIKNYLMIMSLRDHGVNKFLQ